jgi:hypothetical protein
VIPTQTPDEAIEELAFVSGELCLKSIVVYGHVVRDVPPEVLQGGAGDTRWNSWIDFLAIDKMVTAGVLSEAVTLAMDDEVYGPKRS